MSTPTRSMTVTCPQCQAAVQTSAAQLNQRITCPDCLEEFLVKAPAPTAPRAKPSTAARPQDDDIDLEELGLSGDFAPEPCRDFDDILGAQDAALAMGRGGDEASGAAKSSDRPQESAPAKKSKPSQKPATPRESPAPKQAIPPEDPGSLKVDDLFSDLPEVKSVPRVAPNEPYDFTTVCPLCGTRLDTTSERIGQKMKCPDCFVEFAIREPSRSARRPRGKSPEVEDDDFRLSEPAVETPHQKIAGDLLKAAKPRPAAGPSTRTPSPPTPSPPTPERRAPTPEGAIQDMLRQAEREVAQQEEEQPPLPRSPFQQGILRIFHQPATIARCILFTAALYVEVAAIHASIAMGEGGGISQVLGLFVRIFACIFGLLLATYLATTLLVVATETSQGRDAIEGWPAFNVIEWFFDSWTLLASLFLCLAPGFAIGQMAAATGGQTMFWWIGVGGGAIALATAFPLVQLSFMENSAPYSPVVWKSVQVAAGRWVAFFIRGAAVVGLGTGLLVVRILSGSAWLHGLAIAGITVLLFIYFRLLGRLSWACDEALSEASSREGAEG